MTGDGSVGTPPGAADYVIVGAGSAGCVLAGRLSADGARVLLVEAGPVDRKAEIAIPAAFPKLFGTPYDWAFTSAPQPGLGGRELFWPRGRTLGGSSSLNAQIWTRGHRADYDGWAAAGCRGWGFDDVLPYFQRAEDRPGAPGTEDRPGAPGADDPAGYGTGGPIPVSDLIEPSPVTEAFLAACAAAGHRPLGSSETSAPEGFGPVRVTQRNGRRWSAADAYLRPARRRGNVTVLTDAQVRRVIVDGGRATGVEVRTAGGIARIRADREVILAAGAVGSPHLLMLSGIGDPDRLRSAGIAVRLANRHVGRHLADHLYVPLTMRSAEPISPGIGDQRADAAAYLRTRRGRLTSNLAEGLAFLRTDPRLSAPDIELIWMLVPSLDHRVPPDGHGVTLGVVLLRPAGLGEIRPASADPAARPVIDPGYLADPADLRTLVSGLDLARDVLARPELAGRLGAPAVAGALRRDDATTRAFARAHADTLFHPVGTARMGAPDDAVVDLEFRVHGVAGLRVVDASTMPAIPRAHTHAPTVMLAERAADLIRGIPAPRPVAAAAAATTTRSDPR